MKFRLTFSFILIWIVTFNCRSQINSYFENSPKWFVTHTNHNGMDCHGYGSEFYYYISGDTVIGNHIYKRVFKKGFNFSIGFNCEWYNHSEFSNNTPTCFLRSFDKKMFVLYPWQSAEQLLYNFDLNIGDTLPQVFYPVPFSSWPQNAYVTAIDSFYTQNGYMKRFNLAGNNTFQYLYEGGGGLGGLLEPNGMFAMASFTNLNCFTLNDVPELPIGGPCFFSVGLENLPNENKVIVAPNPFSLKTEFLFETNQTDARIKVLNSQGILMRSDVFSGKSYILYKQNLINGIYFYIISTSEGNTSKGRIILQE